MLKKKKNLKKDLKQVQKKGFNNPKTKFSVIFGVALFTVVLCASYALYSYTGSSVAFNSTINKRVKTTVVATNGTVESLSGKILSEEIKTNPNFLSSHSDKGLYVQKGDNTKSIDGKPTYYYRGNVTNNYVKFAGSTWRIVRINEDGTIRIVRTASIESSTYGPTSTYKGSTAENKLNNWYNSNLKSYENLIAETEYCNDISGGGWDRLHVVAPKPSFKCQNSTTNLKIGLITGDEIVYAGHIVDATPPTYINFMQGWSWTMTSSRGGSTTQNLLKTLGWQVSDTASAALYPVINLKADTQVTGEGSSTIPYEVVNMGSLSVKEGDYKVSQEFKVYENEGYVYNGDVSCNNGATGSYNANTKTLTVSNQTQDTTCTVKFEKLKILREAILSENTLIDKTPNFTIGEPPESGSNTGSGVYKTNDDQGESYYFRGGKTQLKNNIKFANKNWKIIRINGDKTIRLILNETIGKSAYGEQRSDKFVGYTYDNKTLCTKENPCEVAYSNGVFNNNFGGQNSTIKTFLEDWYQKTLKNYDDYITYGTFCNDTSSSNTAYTRISTGNPSLNCPNTSQLYGGLYKLKIGLLTVDEMMYSGMSWGMEKVNNFFRYDAWWSMTPRSNNNIFYGHLGNVDRDGYWKVDQSIAIYPVINLKEGTQVTGDGSELTPFVVN